ncbi:uncharacterized protein I303_106018 [Kwoniella dejecticola CBS 10117]|uniref:Uncharacterized protein n=1 Tax=Kwoniella dejecticola CBS 10117 TaxID=1296121 RepID=A0A1A6A116_9TREE|nr:uncharacterized protein I303_06038 [Kwoniella dejecticola CBS 10117]OBR83756.1 hypothetical protein I303_06038 [Kwoniella dejecticola CBS 10117]
MSIPDPRRNSTEPLLPTPTTESDENIHQPNSNFPLANMGVSLSTARVIAPASFVIDFACQLYGMLSSPNMKDIHDANPCSFSPQPFAIAGFFTPQQVLQLIWLRELYRSDRQVEGATLRYTPWYALGNACIAIWMLFWNKNNLKGSNVLVMINTLTQLYYAFALRDPAPKTYQSKLTNAVNITFAGVGVLDLFHNVTAAYFPSIPPNLLVKIATPLLSAFTALQAPLLFGTCIAYDLFGVAVGQHQLAAKALNGLGGGGGEGWARLLGGVGLGVVGIVGARTYGGAKWL